MTTIVHAITEPFPFLQIENLYSEDELNLIWQELEFLNYPHKLKTPENTGTAKDKESNDPLKNNRGLFLDEVYTNRSTSNILSINTKLFSPEILDVFSQLSFGYATIKKTNADKTIISYYENGDYYKPHQDAAVYSGITWFFKEPKLFTGGNLYFTDYDIKIEVQNNMAVLFPSFVTHSVDRIISNNDMLSGHGRYSMAQFLYLTYIPTPDNK